MCARRNVAVKASFIGSTTNIVMIASTTAFLAAGRFGLAPTVNRQATAGLKLQQTDTPPLESRDPDGFNIVDCLALGALGHGVGVGVVLGLKALGAA